MQTHSDYDIIKTIFSLRSDTLKKIPINLILYTVMFLIAGLLVISASRQSHQAVMSIPMPVHFTGEYSQSGGEWQMLDAKTDLSSYNGAVTLRGRFDTELLEGAEIRFYLNHISVDICRDGEILYESIHEKFPDMCGSTWVSWVLPAASPEDVLEIRLYNPHSFGNRDAYNQFLDSIYIGGDVVMKNYFERQSLPYKATSIFILVVSIALIGTAAGYRLLRLPDNSLLLKSGLMSLMMGACVAELLHGKRRKISEIAVYVLMLTDFFLMVVSLAGAKGIYDTGIYWAAVQGAVSLLLLVLTVMEVKDSGKRRGLMQPSAIVLLTVLLLELVNSCTGWWRGGICIKIIFTVLFVFHLVRAAWLVAKNQQDSIRAEMLREELKNSRIVLAMSQIRTHFVFNILNAISGMCEYDPQKADETLVMFAHYLRSNINIMEEDEPEAFTKSLEHLEEYVFLEQVRFGEKIQFAKNIEADNFKIPPLILQPLVENAIRHGLLHKKQGGTVILHTWAENGDSIIEISDDGVGFDMANAPGQESVGMKNVRFRLKYMVGGTMDIKSTPGQGTTVTITIPGKHKIQKTE